MVKKGRPPVGQCDVLQTDKSHVLFLRARDPGGSLYRRRIHPVSGSGAPGGRHLRILIIAAKAFEPFGFLLLLSRSFFSHLVALVINSHGFPFACLNADLFQSTGPKTYSPEEEDALGDFSQKLFFKNLHIKLLDFRPRPGCLPEEPEARSDRRVEHKTPHGDARRKPLPPDLLDQTVQDHFKRHAMERVF